MAPGQVPRVIAGLFSCAAPGRRRALLGTDTRGSWQRFVGVESRPEIVASVGEVVDLLPAAAMPVHRARRRDALRCWGFNDYGQVGDGTTRRIPPTPVTGLGEVVLGRW